MGLHRLSTLTVVGCLVDELLSMFNAKRYVNEVVLFRRLRFYLKKLYIEKSMPYTL